MVSWTISRERLACEQVFSTVRHSKPRRPTEELFHRVASKNRAARFRKERPENVVLQVEAAFLLVGVVPVPRDRDGKQAHWHAKTACLGCKR